MFIEFWKNYVVEQNVPDWSKNIYVYLCPYPSTFLSLSNFSFWSEVASFLYLYKPSQLHSYIESTLTKLIYK